MDSEPESLFFLHFMLSCFFKNFSAGYRAHGASAKISPKNAGLLEPELEVVS
jgi:hypothetical protein